MKKEDLNKLTFAELQKKVEELKEKKDTINKPKGLKYCIVRTYSAGVFAGMYDRRNKSKVGTIYDSRRIWYWDGAASLSQLAVDGTSDPNKCKFPCMVSETDLTEIIEVIPCTDKARKSIESVPVWSR